MKLFTLASALFLSILGLSSCCSREAALVESGDANIAPIIHSNDSIEESPTLVKHKKRGKMTGKVHYFTEFVKKHKSIDKAFSKVTSYENVLVDFYADWCGPCKSLGSYLTTIAPQNPHVLIVKINIEEFPTIAEQFGVRSLPTVLLFKNGTVAEKIKGFNQKNLINSIKTVFN